MVKNISALKRKSTYSFRTAKRLTDELNPEGWNVAIHCYYYSILQYIKYLLAERIRYPISLEEQKNDCGTSSHRYLIDNLHGSIPYIKEKKSFILGIHFLKRARILADYSEELLKYEDCIKCKEISGELRGMLMRIFESDER